MSELQKEICKSIRFSRIKFRNQIAEELADVEIMLEQVKMIFDIEDEDGFAIPIKYDAILFYTGKYEAGKKRDCALVEVTDSLVQYLTDDEGNIIEYKVDYNGQKDVYWQESRVVYQLGTILAVNIFDQSKTKNVL